MSKMNDVTLTPTRHINSRKLVDIYFENLISLRTVFSKARGAGNRFVFFWHGGVPAVFHACTNTSLFFSTTVFK